MTFGEALKKRREAAGFNQTALAAAAGIHQTNISQVERGIRNTLSREVVARLEEVLGIKPGELVKHLPDDHPAHDLVQVELPDMGVVWGSPPDEDVPEPVPGKVFKLGGRFPAGTFTVRVSGNSVHGYGIHNGDRIAVRPTEHAEEGEMIVARCGNAFTLKRCVRGKLLGFDKDGDGEKALDVDEPLQVVGVMVGIVDGERRAVPRPTIRPKPKGPN